MQAVASPTRETQPPVSADRATADRLASHRSFLGITDEDLGRVRALEPAFRLFAAEFVERFYAHLFAFPTTAAFLQDPALVTRLKELQQQYFHSLLQADLSPEYVEGRHRIGQAHAEVGLEPQWFLGAFNQYIQLCFGYFATLPAQQLADYSAGMLSLIKFILLDIGLTLDAYFSRSTEQLRRALELYSQSNAELREFAHLASHDLKTPLAAVAGLCEEFLDEFGASVPPEGRRLVEAARARTMKMKSMIDELLSMSEAAAQPNQRARISPRSVIDEAIDRVRLELGERQVCLDIPNQLPDVYVHPGRLREVFYHLLSNAVKFLDKEPGMVRVSSEPNGDRVVFCVSDNGPGIGPSDQRRIFAPFQRLPQHRHRPGSGLGLYFVRKIVEEQGGRVWVQSKVGEGSRFYIELPRPPVG